MLAAVARTWTHDDPGRTSQCGGSVVAITLRYHGEPQPERESELINISGLSEVADGLYQARNLALSNMTVIGGNEGIPIVDPLVSAATARVVGLGRYYANRG